MSNLVMIVDDDPVQRRLLSGMVEKMGHAFVAVEGGSQALDQIRSDKGKTIKAIILDLMMPEVDGIEVLECMRKENIAIPAIVQTAQGSIETVVKAMQAGAFDFVVKPAAPDRLKTAISQALKVRSKTSQSRQEKKSAASDLGFEDLNSGSIGMSRAVTMGKKASQSRIPVLIDGESGVGKEVFARAIKNASDRRDKPFVTVNCGALPENLVESILFGHEKGSFTGATERRIGKFEEASGGTLFLDEIGELPLDAQVKLLRAIQEGEIDPVGSRKPVKVDIRLISATNRNLYDEVRKGSFREDLYYRLNVLPITLPPLRERPEDIPGLVMHFIAMVVAQEGRSDIVGIEENALKMLSGFDWPGNIRQLENAVFRAVVLCEGKKLTMEDFSQIAAQIPEQLPNLTAARVGPQSDPVVADYQVNGVVEQRAETVVEGEKNVRFISGLPAMETPLEQTSHGWLNLIDRAGEVKKLTDIEAEVIATAIEHYNGRMSEVARRLAIGRSTLYRKLKEYGLDEEQRAEG